jgi:CubicO group peptidase (beta-lactamase class C family)
MSVSTQRVPTLLSWRRALPEREGLVPNVVAEVDRAVRGDFKGVTSVLVARHGRLVVERYYGVRAADRLPVFSITKSIVSTLVGIALADGQLRSPDQRLSEFFRGADPRIRLRHLLSMTAGYGRQLNFGSTEAADLAMRPLANVPGTTFLYDSGSSDLLAEILSRVTGMSAADYARRWLFGPLGIEDVIWPGSHGATGLVIRPRELLAFGQMYLDHGTWNKQRIVSASWVRASTRMHAAPNQGIGGYGYDWWIENQRPHFFAALGYLGQALVVFPGLDEVVLVTSGGADAGTFGLVRLILEATHA